jgi:hypothetical protein
MSPIFDPLVFFGVSDHPLSGYMVAVRKDWQWRSHPKIRNPYLPSFFWSRLVKPSSTKSSLVKHFLETKCLCATSKIHSTPSPSVPYVLSRPIRQVFLFVMKAVTQSPVHKDLNLPSEKLRGPSVSVVEFHRPFPSRDMIQYVRKQEDE